MDNDTLRIILVATAIGVTVSYPLLHKWVLVVCKIVLPTILLGYLYWVFFVAEEPAMKLLFNID